MPGHLHVTTWIVLAEKVSRRGEAISVIGGVAMIVWGVAALMGA